MSGDELRSTTELRRLNRNRVYRALYTAGGPVTKQDLARTLSMSLPTLTQNLKELLSQGLVDDSGTTESTGGRKPRLFAVVSGARFAVGGELTNSQIRLTAIDLEIRQLGHKVIARPFGNNADYAKALADELEIFLDENGLDRRKLLGVGLTLPGIVNEAQSIIEYAPTVNVRKMSVNQLTRFIPYPVFLENDATCGGFAEWWTHAGAERANMAYLSLGRGVGGAILTGGSPYVGVHRRSAEFGHMCIHPGGRVCNCGKRGCLEAYCSSICLSETLRITLDEFFTGLVQGSGDYAAIWEDYLDSLAIGVSNIHVALDCDVVIGGVVSQYLGAYLDKLKARLAALDVFGEEGSYLHLCRFHGKSNSIGAALYYVKDYIDGV